MSEEGWKAARDRFCELARMRSESHGPNSNPANLLALQGFNSLVAEWHREGVVKDILGPLLNSEERTIRIAAASFLVHMGAPDESLKVLRELEPVETSARVTNGER